jgi:hypothetical protein
VADGYPTPVVATIGMGPGRGGEYERALGLFEESMAIGRERQVQDRIARAFLNLGVTTLMLGDVQRARSLLRDGLIAVREIGLVEGFIWGFVGLEGGIRTRGSGTRRARDRPRGHAARGGGDSADRRSCSRRDGSRAPGEARGGRLRSVYADGRALALEDALALALRPD